MSIVEFLLARIAEDEKVARAALDAPDSAWWVNSREQRIVRGDPSTRSPIAEALSWRTAVHIARQDPARALAECEAKRAIISMSASLVWGNESPADVDVLEPLAAVYADHPDYDQAWRP